LEDEDFAEDEFYGFTVNQIHSTRQLKNELSPMNYTPYLESGPRREHAFAWKNRPKCRFVLI